MNDQNSNATSECNSEVENSSYLEDAKLDSYIEAINPETFTNFFNAAKKHRKDGELDEAFMILKALIEKGTSIYGNELHIELADVYFQLGDTWLDNIEKGGEELIGSEGTFNNPSKEDQMAIMSDIMAQITEAQDDMDDDAKYDTEGGNDDENGNGHENGYYGVENGHNCGEGHANGLGLQNGDNNQANDEEEDEEVEDIQIAWENIETARLILQTYLDEHSDLTQDERSQIRRRLAHCYLRLGNCENRKENFTQALTEYNSCLELLQLIENTETSRLIAEICFLMGNTYLYEFENDALEKALYMYKKAREILTANIDEIKNKTDLDSKVVINDLKDICYDLDEKIEELEDEIITNKDDDINKEKIKAIAGGVNDFPKSHFGGEEQVKKLGTFGKKRDLSPLDDDKHDIKKINIEDTDEKAHKSN